MTGPGFTLENVPDLRAFESVLIDTEWTPKDQPWTIKALIRTDLGGSFSKRIGPSRIVYEIDGLTAAVMYSQKL